MWVDGTGNNKFVISKHISFPVNGFTEVSKGITQINNIIYTGTVRNKLRKIYGFLYSIMFLRIPTHWSFVGKMNYIRDVRTIELVMEYISIKIKCWPKIFS